MSTLELSSISVRPQGRTPTQIVIIGAGPTGLAVACELAAAGLSVVVLEARGAPAADGRGRPQLLVARPGDLQSLSRLGVDISDPRVVAPLRSRTTGDRTVAVEPIEAVPPPAPSIFALASQRPVALVPIVRLQRALADVALSRGAEIRYHTKATRVRRHARFASIETDAGAPLRARLVIVATGSARSIADAHKPFRLAPLSPVQHLIGGVFAAGETDGRWERFEMTMGGVPGTLRCTTLHTPTESAAGTALLIAAPKAKSSLLKNYFWGVADLHSFGRDMVAKPQVFATGVSAAVNRTLARDNRAPIVLVGDAAQTGHVFAGLTCFGNLWLALALTERLIESALSAICDGRYGDPALLNVLDDYELLADKVTEEFVAAAEPHLQTESWVANSNSA